MTAHNRHRPASGIGTQVAMVWAKVLTETAIETEAADAYFGGPRLPRRCLSRDGAFGLCAFFDGTRKPLPGIARMASIEAFKASASSAAAAEDARQTTNSPRQIACRLRNARGRYAPADMQLIDARPLNRKE